MKKLIAFFEIPATDFNRAVRFYETILDLHLDICDCGGSEKMAFFPKENGKVTGAISQASGFNPSKDGVLISLQVEDMNSVLSEVEKNGGKALRPKTKIEADGMGHFSIFLDSEGNSVGLYSNE